MKKCISILKIFFKKNYFFDERQSKKIKFSFLFFLIISFLEFLSIGFLILVVLTIVSSENNIPNFLIFFSKFEKQSLLFFIIFFIFFKYLIQIWLTYLEKKILRDLQVDYSAKLLKNYFNDQKSTLFKFEHSEILNNLNNQIKSVFIGFFRPANEFFSELIISISLLLLLLFFIDTKLLFIFFIISIFFGIFLKLISKIANRWGKKRVVAGEELLSNITGVLKNYNIIKLLNKENFFLNKITPIFSILVKSEFIEDIGQKLFRIFLELSAFIIFLSILLILSLENDDQLIEKMIQIFIPSLRLLPSFVKLNTTMNKILYSLPAAIKLQNVMQDLLSSNIQNNLKFEKIYFNQSIEIKNLQFSYNKNKKIISKDFVQFNKNQKYLIQGRSGSGKTTFIELLLGFKKPDEGEFFADSVPYYPVQQPKWKSLFGYVPQEIYLLNETVSSNIAFGEYSNDIDYLKIKKILNTMNLDKVLDLNYKIENYGSNISGGQKQRLGICRALYFNPDILVLDEPTSSLNSEDSLKIMKDILGLNKTIIVVSHDTNITSFFKNIINFK